MSLTATQNRRPCDFTLLGVLEYPRALALQQSILAEKLADRQVPDRLLFVEHPPVYTLGRRGGRENLVVSESFLAERHIDIVQTDRGGNITYHGPGQAVLYPVMDLSASRISVPDFVSGMEEIMKQTCLAFGVAADRDPRNPGLWVREKKIGSVGISIKKGISIHGLALNVNPDLTPFSWINPCGLANQAMTSIAREVNMPSQILTKVSGQQDQGLMKQVANHFVDAFAGIFGIQVESKKIQGTNI